MLKEDLIWQSNMTNNLNLMRSSTIRITKISEYVDVQRSYSKKAFPWDNACMESFRSILKREWLNRFKIRDYKQAYRLIFEYLEAFYNTK